MVQIDRQIERERERDSGLGVQIDRQREIERQIMEVKGFDIWIQRDVYQGFREGERETNRLGVRVQRENEGELRIQRDKLRVRALDKEIKT